MTQTIAYTTDTHLDEAFPLENGADPRENWRKILDDVAARNIDTVIFGGDIGEKGAYPLFFNSLEDYSLKITLGNHDRFEDVKGYYKHDFPLDSETELYYAIEDDYFRYLFLDSSSDEVSEQQLNWFEKELDTAKKVIVFMHHPILAVATEADRQFPLRNREELKAALERLEQDVFVFCGHYHLEDERTEGNIRQFITPASSFQLLRSDKIVVDASVFGYRIIKIAKDTVTTEVVYFIGDRKG